MKKIFVIISTFAFLSGVLGISSGLLFNDSLIAQTRTYVDTEDESSSGEELDEEGKMEEESDEENMREEESDEENMREEESDEDEMMEEEPNEEGTEEESDAKLLVED